MAIDGGFINLKVWEKAHRMALAVYKITETFPKNEQFGLTSQMRRASFSVPANIAEGYKRSTDRDYAHFLEIAEGSLEELKYYLILTRDLDFITKEQFSEFNEKCNEVGRMLSSFRKKLTA